MIQFVQPLEPERLRTAYNNDVVRFYTDVSTEPDYADLTLGTGPTLRLYSAPDGRFYFNFKPYVTTLINTNNFEDTLVSDLTVSNVSSFAPPAPDIALKLDVTFTISAAQGVTDAATHSLNWLAAAQQLGSYRPLAVTGLHVLTPQRTDAANVHYLKYWVGYPFDISFYSIPGTLNITNQANLLSQNIPLADGGTRLFFGDGRTDETLEDLLPLNDGFNTLKLLRDGDTDTQSQFIHIEKEANCSGVYLKWFNAQGGYSYWLFENTYSIDRNAKTLGELDRDFENLPNSSGRSIQTGRQSQDTLKIVAELLTPAQRDIVQNLLESPKVYLFTGLPYSRSSYQDWIEVSVKTTSARIRNARETLTNFAFDIELPERFTQML
jgi:hypothetical protein